MSSAKGIMQKVILLTMLVCQPVYADGFCLYPRIVGICIWIWPYPLNIEVTIKIGHFNPDVIVYVNREGALSTQDNPVYPSKGSAEVDDNERGHKDLMFKHALAAGNPLSGQIYCPTQADTTIYFTSEIDIPSWKWVGLDSLDSAAFIPGQREVDVDENWGALYPRSGWVIQQSDPKTAGIIAQRVGDIITRESEPHIYDDDLASQMKIFVEDEMFTWAPDELIENVFDEGWWERISPDFKIQCDIFGEDGSDEAVDDNGDYIYILWRPYTCCEIEPGFLIYIDFMKYPS